MQHETYIQHFAEVRNTYTDEQNYTYIDVWETDDENEEGAKVAIVDRDNGKVFFIDGMYCNHPQILESISEVKKDIEAGNSNSI